MNFLVHAYTEFIYLLFVIEQFLLSLNENKNRKVGRKSKKKTS